MAESVISSTPNLDQIIWTETLREIRRGGSTDDGKKGECHPFGVVIKFKVRNIDVGVYLSFSPDKKS